MSKQEQIKCGKFIEDYLEMRQNISLIIFVLDIRHMPTANDKIMYDYIISNNKPFIIIANKADKIAITKVDEQVTKISNFLNPLHDICFYPFSSVRKCYTDVVWNKIEKYI